MTFLPPYAVDGATIPASLLRQSFYQTAKGETGVLGADSLRPVYVEPGVVGIMPGVGAVSVPDRMEAYQVSNDALVEVGVPAAGGTGQSRYIIVRVTDPQYHGQSGEVEVALVGSTAGETKPYLVLGRIVLGAGETFTDSSEFYDLREIAAPRSRRMIRRATATAGQALTSTSFTAWPSQGVDVTVPAWSNYLTVRVDLLAGHFSPEVRGQLRVLIDDRVVGTVSYNQDLATGSQRVPLLVTGETSMDLAGQTVALSLEGTRESGYTGHLETVTDAQFVFDVTFEERAG